MSKPQIMEDYNPTGAQLKTMRNQLQLTAKEAADKFNVSLAFIEHIEADQVADLPMRKKMQAYYDYLIANQPTQNGTQAHKQKAELCGQIEALRKELKLSKSKICSYKDYALVKSNPKYMAQIETYYKPGARLPSIELLNEILNAITAYRGQKEAASAFFAAVKQATKQPVYDDIAKHVHAPVITPQQPKEEDMEKGQDPNIVDCDEFAQPKKTEQTTPKPVAIMSAQIVIGNTTVICRTPTVVEINPDGQITMKLGA